MTIEVKNLNYSYPNGKEVLKDISFTISEPGLYCILGPNGVGKSTLVKCIDKLLEPSSGTISVNGKDVKDCSVRDISEVISYVPVSSATVFSLTVLDSVLMGRHGGRKWRNSKEDLDIVYKAMKIFGLDGLAMRNTNELSAGQNQSVGLARGLVQDTEIIILDEPTANLDVRHQVYVTELFSELALRTGKIVIMISHDLNITAKYAKQIILMSEPGVIYRIGTPDEIITSENIEYVYGVRCDVFTESGHPLVSLGHPLSDTEIEEIRQK